MGVHYLILSGFGCVWKLMCVPVSETWSCLGREDVCLRKAVRRDSLKIFAELGAVKSVDGRQSHQMQSCFRSVHVQGAALWPLCCPSGSAHERAVDITHGSSYSLLTIQLLLFFSMTLNLGMPSGTAASMGWWHTCWEWWPAGPLSAVFGTCLPWPER
jgi:hypothetical protein